MREIKLSALKKKSNLFGILAVAVTIIVIAGSALAVSTMNPKITYTGNGIPDNGTGREGDLYVDLDTSVLWVFRNSSWQMFAIFPVVVNGTEGPIGPTGPQGPQGEQGPMGPQGPQGEQGLAGIDGVNGTSGIDGKDGVDGNTWFHGNTAPDPELGKDGDLYLDYATWDVYAKESDSWVALGNIKGEQGEQGIQGETGPQGVTGSVGPAGPQGETGAIGPAGSVGIDGVDGTDGVKGTDGRYSIEIPWWIIGLLSVASGSAVLTSVYAVSRKDKKNTKS